MCISGLSLLWALLAAGEGPPPARGQPSSLLPAHLCKPSRASASRPLNASGPERTEAPGSRGRARRGGGSLSGWVGPPDSGGSCPGSPSTCHPCWGFLGSPWFLKVLGADAEKGRGRFLASRPLWPSGNRAAGPRDRGLQATGLPCPWWEAGRVGSHIQQPLQGEVPPPPSCPGPSRRCGQDPLGESPSPRR